MLRPVLEAEGVLHAALFGSVARGDDVPDSDIDLILDLDPARKIGVFAFAGIKELLESELGRRVDLGTRDSLRPSRHAEILADLLPVFQSSLSDASERREKCERYLQDIVEYGSRAFKKIDGVSRSDFVDDLDAVDAVYYRMQCVSEAVRNVIALDPEIMSRAPEIPWPRIRTIGNILRHHYGGVDAVVIWQTVTGADLQALLTVARRELKRLQQ